MMRRHIAVITAVCLLMSCAAGTAYHHFEHTEAMGWDKRDTFYFKVDTILHAGNYAVLLCLRADAEYPYRSLSVRMMCEVRPGGTVSAHTVTLDMIRENGTRNGDGITYYTIEMPIDTLFMRPGDSLLMKVAHNMRRETMPGIMDVGVKVAEVSGNGKAMIWDRIRNGIFGGTE